MRLTILFDDPYWVGILELEHDGLLTAFRHIFGAEPSDQLVYAFVQSDLAGYLHASATAVAIPVDTNSAERRVNPKRAQREVRRQVLEQGYSTHAQEAIRQQFEQNKQQRKVRSRAERDALRDHKRDVAHAKARARHRGH